MASMAQSHSLYRTLTAVAGKIRHQLAARLALLGVVDQETAVSTLVADPCAPGAQFSPMCSSGNGCGLSPLTK